jgi:hypothetical protein
MNTRKLFESNLRLLKQLINEKPVKNLTVADIFSLMRLAGYSEFFGEDDKKLHEWLLKTKAKTKDEPRPRHRKNLR